MNAEIITIGDEILIGQILDTNSKWIAEELNKIGISVYQITSIQDDRQHILDAVKDAESRVDIVIITGGLGPTKDDITKHTLAKYFDDVLVDNKEIKEHIKYLFSKVEFEYTPLDLQQAMLPKKATIIKNYLGTASGMCFERNNKMIISLPGVPNEMKGLISHGVLSKIQEKFHLPYIIHKTVMTYGMGESKVAERIEKWEDKLPEFINFAYLPSYGKLRLRLSAKGFDKGVLEKSLEKNISGLYNLIGDIITGVGESETIEKTIGKLLKEKEHTVSTAESCTGGAVAQKITSVAGASSYFVGSVVSYTATIKINELNVSEETIKKYSVVSAEVAEAMALGIQQKFKTNYAIATTGNAGPTTDKTDKTVGVVFIAIASPKGVFSEEFYFGKPRQKVIERTTNKALEMLRKEIIKNS